MVARWRHIRPWFLLATTACLAGCEGQTFYPEVELVAPQIVAVRSPSPTGVGSTLTVQGARLESLGQNIRLLVSSSSGESVATLSSIPGSLRLSDAQQEVRFLMNAEAMASIGTGERTWTFRLEGSGTLTDPFVAGVQSADLAGLETILMPESLPRRDVYRNETVVVAGRSFLAPNEGRVCAKFVGTFTPNSGSVRQVSVAIPMDVPDVLDRTSARMRLSTDLGGPDLGLFSGTIAIVSTPWSTQFPSMTTAPCESAATRSSAASPISLRFVGPRITSVFGAVPEGSAAPTGTARVSLGQYLVVNGDGFLGGADLLGRDSSTEFTTFRIQGTFTPTGGAPITITGDSAQGLLIPDLLLLQGNQARIPMDYIATQEPSFLDRRLVSSRFNQASGTFNGTIVATTHSGNTELTSPPVALRFDLTPPKQVVHVAFLTSFELSLARFGLAAAAHLVRARVLARMMEIYQGVNIEFRLQPPTDFRSDAFTTVEVGGPDPNGRNLFGLENQIAKDTNNLNLGDVVGGFDARAAAMGDDAFGGVFVESILLWSSHPEIPGLALRPNMRPAAADRALFDSIFDPVRNEPVLSAELTPGNPSQERRQQIERAVLALGNIIGGTTAHELGHALGLAQPYTQPMPQGACGRDNNPACVDYWHSEGQPVGCLMNAGGAQPLSERMGLPGSINLRFCGDEVSYLQGILRP